MPHEVTKRDKVTAYCVCSCSCKRGCEEAAVTQVDEALLVLLYGAGTNVAFVGGFRALDISKMATFKSFVTSSADAFRTAANEA